VLTTSTLVLAASVLTRLLLLFDDGLDRRLTLPVVLRVVDEPDDEPDDEEPDEAPAPVVSVPEALPSPPRERKSDLIKPLFPSTLTFDHPAGSCSDTSTLVFLTTVVTTLAFVDAADLTLTPAVVLNVAVPLIGNFRKSDLIKPVEPPTVTFDQPAGL